jgi:hypothetical protein
MISEVRRFQMFTTPALLDARMVPFSEKQRLSTSFWLVIGYRIIPYAPPTEL